MTAGAHGQRGPTRQRHKIGDGAEQRELTDGEVSGGSIFTIVLSLPTRIDW